MVSPLVANTCKKTPLSGAPSKPHLKTTLNSIGGSHSPVNTKSPSTGSVNACGVLFGDNHLMNICPGISVISPSYGSATVSPWFTDTVRNTGPFSNNKNVTVYSFSVHWAWSVISFFTLLIIAPAAYCVPLPSACVFYPANPWPVLVNPFAGMMKLLPRFAVCCGIKPAPPFAANVTV